MLHVGTRPSRSPIISFISLMSCIIVFSAFQIQRCEGRSGRPPPRTRPPPRPRRPPQPRPPPRPPRPFPPLPSVPSMPPPPPVPLAGVVSILISSSKANSLLNCTSSGLSRAIKSSLNEIGVNDQRIYEPSCMQGEDFIGAALDVLFHTQAAVDTLTLGLYRGGAAKLLKSLKVGCGQDSALLLWDSQSNRVSRWACRQPASQPPSPSPPPSPRVAGGGVASVAGFIGDDDISTAFYPLSGLCCIHATVNKTQ